MKHSDYVVQEKLPEFDRDCLHRKLFAVNMQKYRTSPHYEGIIRSMVAYMSWFLDQTWEDYDPQTSVGAASLGLGHNIVLLKTKDGEKKAFLNPAIIEASSSKMTTWTNNGSLRLKTKISVLRHEWISVRYYGLDGNLYFDEKLDRAAGCYALQHEIDSNNGITITDRANQQHQDRLSECWGG